MTTDDLKGKMNSKTDFYFKKAGKWQQAYAELRKIMLDCQLTEELKWGVPCYTFEDNNIVLIHGFKDYCAILFMKGALLNDPLGILVQQTENVQSARQIRFTDADEIVEMEHVLKGYVTGAIEVEKSGLTVEFKTTSEYTVPDELQKKFDENPALKTAFEALTPGRQRGYILHFSAPKQSKTRTSRIEKNIPKILDGKGLDD